MGKVKLSLCLIKHYAMKTCMSGGIAPPFLILVLGGAEWSASRFCHFTPQGRSTQSPLDAI
jgi:hypothetical protein